jgi:hypothetical protein
MGLVTSKLTIKPIFTYHKADHIQPVIHLPDLVQHQQFIMKITKSLFSKWFIFPANNVLCINVEEDKKPRLYDIKTVNGSCGFACSQLHDSGPVTRRTSGSQGAVCCHVGATASDYSASISCHMWCIFGLCLRFYFAVSTSIIHTVIKTNFWDIHLCIVLHLCIVIYLFLNNIPHQRATNCFLLLL